MAVTFDAQITFLPCSDLGQSREFYSDVLGLELVLDQGACLIWRVAGDAYVGVCGRDEFTPSDGVILTIVTDHVDDTCERVLAAGWTIMSGPQQNEEFDIYQAFVHDPDGNVIEIQRFDDPSWAGAT